MGRPGRLAASADKSAGTVTGDPYWRPLRADDAGRAPPNVARVENVKALSIVVPPSLLATTDEVSPRLLLNSRALDLCGRGCCTREFLP